MEVERKDLIEILDVLTYAIKRAGGKEIILIGGVALGVLERGRGTEDVDVFIRDKTINIAAQEDVIETGLKKACSEKGCSVSEIKHTFTTSYFDVTLPAGKTIKVEILSTLDKPVDLEDIINRLGAFTLTRMNEIDIKCPTYESISVMKLQSMDYHRPQDLDDLRWLYNHINRDKVMSFCTEHNLISRYERVFGAEKRKKIRGIKEDVKGKKITGKGVDSYPELYKLALKLPDETLRIALRRLHYPVPKSHEGKARLYARYYSSKKKGEDLQEFRYYVRWKGNQSSE